MCVCVCARVRACVCVCVYVCVFGFSKYSLLKRINSVHSLSCIYFFNLLCYVTIFIRILLKYGEVVQKPGQRIYGKSLFLPLSFAVNLKLL